MVVVTVQDDRRIELPDAVCERLGLRPGTRLALEEGNGGRALHLHILSDEVQLVEKDGVWVLRLWDPSPAASEEDWVSRSREERLAFLADPAGGDGLT
jgi:bifunctional DNA-binding transcriptional regulator/antitoxin component of YhaV-PrlF toxin-antitoxin module